MRYPVIASLFALTSCLANSDLSAYSRGEPDPPDDGGGGTLDPVGSAGASGGGVPGEDLPGAGSAQAGAAGASAGGASSDGPMTPEGSASASAGGAASGGAGGAGSPLPEPEPAGVASLLPPDGASGVASDARIVITFEESMDVGSVEAAFRSEQLSADQLTFTWSTDARVLTLTPAAPLSQASGTDPERVVAQRYAYAFVAGARTASGASVAPFEASFTTQREITTTLAPVPDNSLTGNFRSDGLYGSFTCAETGNQICIGDGSVAANAFYRALLSFDLGVIPAAAQTLSRARLQLAVVAVAGQPFATLGAIELEHVEFAAIGVGAFDVAPLAALGVLATAAAAGENLGSDVLDAVQDDLLDDGLSQFRLRFQVGTDSDDTPDFVTLARNAPRLSVTYLVP